MFFSAWTAAGSTGLTAGVAGAADVWPKAGVIASVAAIRASATILDCIVTSCAVGRSYIRLRLAWTLGVPPRPRRDWRPDAVIGVHPPSNRLLGHLGDLER